MPSRDLIREEVGIRAKGTCIDESEKRCVGPPARVTSTGSGIPGALGSGNEKVDTWRPL